MEDRTYSFHLHVSCEDTKTDLKFSYIVSINLTEIKVSTSNKNSYIRTPEEMEITEFALRDQETKELVRNLIFQNKVNVKVIDGQYKIIT